MATVARRIKSAFILDKAKITRILDILEQRLKDARLPFEPKYEVTLSDEKKLYLTSVDELLNLDNTIRNPISSLIIKVPSSQTKLQSVIEYGGGGIFLDVALRVVGDNSKAVDQLFAELEEQVERTLLNNWIYKLKGYWSYILVISIGFILPLLFALVLIVTNTTSDTFRAKDVNELIQKANKSSSLEDKVDFLFELNKKQLEVEYQERPTPNFQGLFNLKNLFIVLPLVIIIGCASYAIMYCYPKRIFLWGDYEEYYNSIVARRKTLWNVVILSILLGILTNLFVIGLSEFI